MLAGHNPSLVALSLLVAILGGYTGFGLAARLRSAPGSGRRTLLAGAATCLAVSIWTMHFVGMLAAPLPAAAAYLLLPTVVSFLICALVVGVSLSFVSIGEPSRPRVAASALLLGGGIMSMHYVGIHALADDYAITHDPWLVGLSALIAVGAAYGGLRIFLARQGGMRLAASAVAFGLAVSGMHYTAMAGMRLRPLPAGTAGMTGLSASAEVLALPVAVLCFMIVAAFLLFLVPDPHRRPAPVVGVAVPDESERAPVIAGTVAPPRPPPAARLPVEGPDGTHFIDAAEIRSVRANAHYTLVHDGTRERMCPWSISEAEAQLDPVCFLRIHRSHIVAVAHVVALRREGDGATVELGGAVPHRAPVSRARIVEVKARLGTAARPAAMQGAP